MCKLRQVEACVTFHGEARNVRTAAQLLDYRLASNEVEFHLNRDGREVQITGWT